MNGIGDSVIHLETDFEIPSSGSPNETGTSVDAMHPLCSLAQTRQITKGHGLYQKGYQARRIPSNANPWSNDINYLKVVAVPGPEALNRAGP